MIVLLEFQNMQTLGVHQPLGNANRQISLPAGTRTVQPGVLYLGKPLTSNTQREIQR